MKKVLQEHVHEGELYRTLNDGVLECFACGHRCKLKDGRDGICKVRFNLGGKLFVPWEYVGGLQLDPVEKKPFFHALPGCTALSFGMLGCDYHCSYCQNWVTSQAIRDDAAVSDIEITTPEMISRLALKHGAKIVTSTYNEPLITSEWGVAVFREARKAGLITSYVSNGNGTPEVIEYLRPWVDLYKVDLKGFDDKHYRSLGGVLNVVLDTIGLLYRKGFWLEVVTLLIPGFNDSEAEIRDIAKFLRSVSADIPWHVTAFHSDYKMSGTPNTSVRAVRRAAEIGYECGLHYVYAGNISGQAGDLENTRCPSCHVTVIERRGYSILSNSLESGHCPNCKTVIPGVWNVPGKSSVSYN